MKELKILYDYLNSNSDKKILFLTTSNRWVGDKELPKSSVLAEELKNKLDNCQIINVAKLKIFPCEGNVSTKRGNTCGLKEAMLKDKEKNPHNIIRCWASINNKSDEMHKVANAIYESDIIIFFGSVRWGKMNAIYSTLIERLTWLENRHATLGESNLLKDKEAGIIAIGQNWNGENAIETEKEVFKYFGFNTPDKLTFSWQYTNNPEDETKESYKKAYDAFLEKFHFEKELKENNSELYLRNMIREIIQSKN